MIRMKNLNSSCDCGKTTKERGSFVTKSKIYETRSGANIMQGDVFTEDKNDVKVNSLNIGDELLLKKMETTLVNVPPINNKSFNFRNSTINISKNLTSTNKPCDNMVVTNGNARSLIGDALDDIKSSKELKKLDVLECNNCVRSNTNLEESNKVSNEDSIPQVQPDESEEKLREDKQNGVYERCDNGESCLNGKSAKNCENGQNSNDSVNSSLDGKASNTLVNGYLNGSECGLKNNEVADFTSLEEINRTGENICDVEDGNSESIGDKRKRKSPFEKLFESYAEIGCLSDLSERRSRRPPESYSPEPNRRIKLETLFDEKSILELPSKVKKKVVRKPRQKGPIFHYLDLYIKNKNLKNSTIKQEIVEEVLIDPTLIKQEEIDVDEVFESCLEEDPSTVRVLRSNSLTVDEDPQIETDIVSTNADITDIANTPEDCVQEDKLPMRTLRSNSHTPDQLIEENISLNAEIDEEDSQSSRLLRSTSHVGDPQFETDTLSTTNTEIFDKNKTSLASFIEPEIFDNNTNLDPPMSVEKDINISGVELNCKPLEKISASLCPAAISAVLELPNNNCFINKNSKNKTKLLNKKHKKNKKVKAKPLTYDADISRILGYRQNKGGNREFLVLFHNGTSNWITQDNNITIIPSYNDYFENSEQELSTINRLAFLINLESNKDDSSETESNCGEDMSTTELDNIEKESLGTEKCSIDPLLVSPSAHTVVTPDGSTLVSPNSDLSPDNSINNTNLNGECQKMTSPELSPSDFLTGYNESIRKSDLNELCNYTMSSRHCKLYPAETSKEIVFKRDEEFMHIYLTQQKPQLGVKKVDEQLNFQACEKLIYTLEDCAVDDSCEVVVISGVEEYFAHQSVFDKLLKKPATVEGKNYEQDVSMLRYLIQTIRNFTKPICAVIKKTATGLPASMLSLFDLVFDERGENFMNKKPKPKASPEKVIPKKKSHKKVGDKKSRKIDELESEDFQSYLFPRLMGLTESNESQIMGEGQKLNDYYDIDELLSSSSYNKRTFSQQLRKSLRNMKNNTKIQNKNRGRQQSVNSEEELENIAEEKCHSVGVPQCNVTSPPSVVVQANIDNLEKEIEREKELTKRSMDELESILHSMESC